MDKETPVELTPQVSVVLCAYTERRWNDLLMAIYSVQEQSVPANEIIVVIDNNPQLFAQLQKSVSGVVAIENTGTRGAGEARNRGVDLATGSIIAFLDDDAIASKTWIERAQSAFMDDRVLGVGGAIAPAWEGTRPQWMAEEFYWTVGCTYPGLPATPEPIRNLIAANMFVRRSVFVKLGGFRSGFGKTGARSGTEETDLCIRGTQRWPQGIWLYDVSVSIHHKVPKGRSRLNYFIARCYDEGIAKASIVDFVGGQDGLASERVYTTRTLPRGFVRGLKDFAFGRDATGVARSTSIVLGLTSTVIGYLLGRIALRYTALPTRDTEEAGLRLRRWSRRDVEQADHYGSAPVGDGFSHTSGDSLLHQPRLSEECPERANISSATSPTRAGRFGPRSVCISGEPSVGVKVHTPGHPTPPSTGWPGESRKRAAADCLLLMLAFLTVVVCLSNVTNTGRPLLVLAATCLVPGGAVLTRLPTGDALEALGLAVGLSFCIETAGALAMVWTGWWHPFALATGLILVACVMLSLDLRRVVVTIMEAE